MPASQLLADAGLTRAELADPESPVAITAIFALWEALLRRVRDEALPMTVAQGFSLEHYPVLGFAVMTALSGREALTRVTRFSRIVSTAGHWSLEEAPSVVRLRWHRPGPLTLGHRLANEANLAELVHAARQVFGGEVPLLAASFRHAAPANTAAHRAHFRARLHWQQAADELTFSSDMLKRVPSAASPALSAHFEAQAAQLLSRSRQEAALPLRVQQAVEAALASGEPPAARIAAELGLSERSLRRGLAQHGSSFRAIVEATRKQRAQLLLLDQRASVAEVALMLGFSELSAFSRAFKRWTGRSPRDARSHVAQNV